MAWGDLNLEKIFGYRITPGLQFGEIAVHQALDPYWGAWRVTHVGTGLALGGFADLPTAGLYAVELDGLLDWAPVTLARHIPPLIREQIRALRRTWGAAPWTGPNAETRRAARAAAKEARRG